MDHKTIAAHQAYLDELKIKIREWENNIKALKVRAGHVKPHVKAEFDQYVERLIVKLSTLQEDFQQLRKADKMNKRTVTATQRTLKEMEEAFIDALSKARQH